MNALVEIMSGSTIVKWSKELKEGSGRLPEELTLKLHLEKCMDQFIAGGRTGFVGTSPVSEAFERPPRHSGAHGTMASELGMFCWTAELVDSHGEQAE